MSIFEVEIILYPSGRNTATLTITSPDNLFVQRVEAEEAIQWMALILMSDGKLSVRHNVFNPNIVTYTAMGAYDAQE